MIVIIYKLPIDWREHAYVKELESRPEPEPEPEP
jgi:hypothetical protein